MLHQYWYMLGVADYCTSLSAVQMHPSLVGGSIIYAGNGREFDIVYSKWSDGLTQKTAQYVVHPVGSDSQLG